MKKQVKKVILVIALMMLSLTFTMTAEAAVKKSGKVNNINYKISGTTLTFSGKGELKEKTVDKICNRLVDMKADPWDRYTLLMSIDKIVIAEGITKVTCDFGKDLHCVSTVSLPASLKEFNTKEEITPFGEMMNLTKITVAKKNKKFKTKNKMLLSKNGKILYRYFGTSAKVKVPASVEEIYGYAFSRNMNVKKITLPGSLKKIGPYAFSYIWNLNTIVVPKSCETIGAYAFSNNSNLKKVVLRKGVKRIEEYAFAFCDGLNEIEFPNGLEYIGDNAFFSTELKSIIIPASVTEIGKYAFTVSKKVKSVTFMGKKAPKIGELPFTIHERSEGSVHYTYDPVSKVIVPAGATGFDTEDWSSYRIVYQ